MKALQLFYNINHIDFWATLYSNMVYWSMDS
jgi:hypothetical protein